MINLQNGNQRYSESQSISWNKNHPIVSVISNITGLADSDLTITDRSVSDDYFVNPDYAYNPTIYDYFHERNKSDIRDQFGVIEDVIQKSKNIETELTNKEAERQKI